MPRILLLGLSTVAAIFMTTDTAQAQTAGWLERSVDRWQLVRPGARAGDFEVVRQQ